MLLEKLPEIVAEEEEAAGDGGGAGLNPEGSFSQVGNGTGAAGSFWNGWAPDVEFVVRWWGL